jgi:hypothetical protein
MKAFVIHPEDAEPPSDDREYQSAWDSTNTEKVTDLNKAETLGAKHTLGNKPGDAAHGRR